MSNTIIPREQAAANLSVTPEVLIRYESRGLVRVVRQGTVEGYEPTEVRRLWSIVSFHRDLGVNLAGVEAILQLRERIDHLHRQLHQLSIDLRAALDEADGEATDAP